jgi:hypothetical protein
LDSKFSKSRIEGLPEMSSGAASRNAEQVWNLERGAQKGGMRGVLECYGQV